MNKPIEAPAFLPFGVTTPSASYLRSLIALFNDNRLTPEQREKLDKIELTNVVQFDDAKPDAPAHQTIFESGVIAGVHFRFSEPMAFNGLLELDFVRGHGGAEPRKERAAVLPTQRVRGLLLGL